MHETNKGTGAEDYRRAAERLLGHCISAVTRAGAGANSHIHRVESERGTFALKTYPARADDVRPRAEVEWRTLSFLRDRGLESVPLPVAIDPQGAFLLMEWIDGELVGKHQPGDIDHAADFLSRIFVISKDKGAADFLPASEACLSTAEIVRQLEYRLVRFVPHSRLDEFLRGHFATAFAQAKGALAQELEAPIELDEGLRRLIPADFGFHNAMRDRQGMLRYIDFDYFGWDDPVKLTADFLLHPAMQLSEVNKQDFTSRMVSALPQDPEFHDRLRRHLPLYALRWALIVLNPFRRDRAKRPAGNDMERNALFDARIERAHKYVQNARSLLAF